MGRVKVKRNMPSFINKVKIFAGSGSQPLAQKIAKSYGQDLGSVTVSFSLVLMKRYVVAMYLLYNRPCRQQIILWSY
jgi:hypothetical protein